MMWLPGITGRKQAEKELRESEEKTRLLLNSTAEAIYGLDMNGIQPMPSPTTAYWMKGCISSRSHSPEKIWLPRCGRHWIRNRIRIKKSWQHMLHYKRNSLFFLNYFFTEFRYFQQALLPVVND
jgi:PAS domain-containing protein